MGSRPPGAAADFEMRSTARVPGTCEQPSAQQQFFLNSDARGRMNGGWNMSLVDCPKFTIVA